MDKLEVLRELAIIIIFAKAFGLLARKVKAPQVAGEIIAGLLIGPSVLGLVAASDFLSAFAEIGVILLMFTAGLETDLTELKKTGIKATIIACAGVFVPLILGTLLYFAFYRDNCTPVLGDKQDAVVTKVTEGVPESAVLGLVYIYRYRCFRHGAKYGRGR